MARRHKPTKVALVADPVYQNLLIQMIVNRLMKEGKKSLAYRLCYGAMKQIEETTQHSKFLFRIRHLMCTYTKTFIGEGRYVYKRSYPQQN